MRKKRKNNSKGSIESQMPLGNWSGLPNDLLLKIFNTLNHKDLFWIISSVCRSWQLACWDILFWEDGVLNLMHLSNLCTTDIILEDKFDKMGLALMRVMKSLFDHHGNMLENKYRSSSRMMLPPFQHADKHLVYVAERSSKLKGICLSMFRVTGKVFSRAIRNWRELHTIAMGVFLGDQDFTHVIQEVGINCERLKRLVIFSFPRFKRNYFFLDEYNSEVIARNLHNLRQLVLSDCYLYKLGLQTIMSKCNKLQKLELLKCRRAVEDVKLTRRRIALDSQRLQFIGEHVSARIVKSGGSDGEWFMNKLAGEVNTMSIIDYLWKETVEAKTEPA